MASGRDLSLHDLLPLDVAANLIFGRVYGNSMARRVSSRLGDHLDGLAYTIAELSPIYMQTGDGKFRQLSKQEILGGLFQDGARALSYIDGRPSLRNLAVSSGDIEGLVETLKRAQLNAERPPGMDIQAERAKWNK